MSEDLKYFLIPYEQVPEQPAYAVWFATWSQDRPRLEPGMNPPMVVGATTEDRLPAGAVLLAGASKDPQPPPPPPPPSFTASDYQRAVSDWLSIGRDGDE
jgi:hypothetical protein